MSIKPGQVYRSLSSRHHPCNGPTRIRIKGVIPYGSGQVGRGTANVVTVLADGSEVRPRSVKLALLHESPTTWSGERRRTGYVLETEPTEES